MKVDQKLVLDESNKAIEAENTESETPEGTFCRQNAQTDLILDINDEKADTTVVDTAPERFGLEASSALLLLIS